MAIFPITRKVRERYPSLNFYGVKIENLQVTDKLLYVKARKKKIQKDFRKAGFLQLIRWWMHAILHP